MEEAGVTIPAIGPGREDRAQSGSLGAARAARGACRAAATDGSGRGVGDDLSGNAGAHKAGVAQPMAGGGQYADLASVMLLPLPLVRLTKHTAKFFAGLHNRCSQLWGNRLAQAKIVLGHLTASHLFEHIVDFP